MSLRFCFAVVRKMFSVSQKKVISSIRVTYEYKLFEGPPSYTFSPHYWAETLVTYSPVGWGQSAWNLLPFSNLYLVSRTELPNLSGLMGQKEREEQGNVHVHVHAPLCAHMHKMGTHMAVALVSVCMHKRAMCTHRGTGDGAGTHTYAQMGC